MWWSHLKDTGMLVNGDHHPISMVENSKKSPIT
jgi:D-aminopeptidase